MKGPDLPCSFDAHAHVSITETVSLIIGGCYHDTTLTYYYNQKSQKWTSGPQLIEGSLHNWQLASS